MLGEKYGVGRRLRKVQPSQRERMWLYSLYKSPRSI
ncbi:MAG: hypothetical protein QOF54_1879 [Solirubrobacteraceae bacterium]|jgi:hypothetical protein|nr:hypothetical protein [Solirubrobacteraceae bacterium]